MLARMFQDLRYALRTLRKDRGFTLTAVLTLALGVGLNTAVFAIVNVLLFRPPDVRESDRLVRISSYPTGPDGPRTHVSYADLEALGNQPVFSAVAGYGSVPISIANGRQAARVNGQIVASDFFGLLGVRPALGRGLAEAPRGTAGAPVVVIGDALWRRLFNGQASAVGSPVVVNGRAFSVAGVMPAGFTGVDSFEPADVWLPISERTAVLPRLPGALESGTFWLNVIARLSPGASILEARAAVRVLADSATRQYPESHKDFGLQVTALTGLGPHDRSEVVPVSALLLGVTLLVLLIACANVANLLLARGVKRDPELRVRLALGGSRWRIVRQLLVESSLIAVLGAVAGLLLALWGADLLLRIAEIPVPLNSTPDRRVLAFTVATVVATTFLFGLVPALRASRVSLFPALREAGAVDARKPRVQRALVTAQLAASLVLLSGTGMLLHSLAAVHHVDVGFATNDRFSIDYDVQLQGYSDDRAQAFNRTLLDRVRALPGVRSATIAKVLPAGGMVYLAPVHLAGADRNEAGALHAAFNDVSPGFFKTMGISLVAGRDFTDADAAGHAPVAVISQQLATQYWPGVNPLGQRLKLDAAGEPVREVIGVARDVMIDGYNERPWAVVYRPYTGAADRSVLIVETREGPGWMASVSRDAAREFTRLDANLPLGKATSFDEHLAGRLDKERALTRLLAIAGALALFLAALGLYGVVSHAVAGRRREVGVRMALGAARADVLGLFIRQSARLVALGITIAVPLAVALSAVVSGSLVGVSPGDPLPILGAASLLVITMLVATWIPARRASGVDPSIVLKAE